MWRKGDPPTLSMGMQLRTLQRRVWRFLRKLKMELAHDPAIPVLAHFRETIVQKDACTPVIIAKVFTIARTWRQPKCPSTGEWMKKMR